MTGLCTQRGKAFVACEFFSFLMLHGEEEPTRIVYAMYDSRQLNELEQHELGHMKMQCVVECLCYLF